mmetsp:Transcript_13796/g.20907  ORF Transcript_13796/g.20907 Transcript_13796/m.20907 type:complete len:151 (+) Transcript_13796:37-489(+)
MVNIVEELEKIQRDTNEIKKKIIQIQENIEEAKRKGDAIEKQTEEGKRATRMQGHYVTLSEKEMKRLKDRIKENENKMKELRKENAQTAYLSIALVVFIIFTLHVFGYIDVIEQTRNWFILMRRSLEDMTDSRLDTGPYPREIQRQLEDQ